MPNQILQRQNNTSSVFLCEGCNNKLRLVVLTYSTIGNQKKH